MSRILVTVLLMALGFAACKKYEDKVGNADGQLENRYCNDPEAVNYNWGFPGKPDNAICFFPTSVFEGTYILSDSIFYSTDFIFTKAVTDTITISKKSPDSHTKLLLSGWCGVQMDFTADRFYKATADSLFGGDTIIRAGQLFCHDDTLSGFIIKDKTDDKRLRLNFTIRTDTGSKVVFHVGTAIKK
jgi:hypothetical protein